MAETLAGWTESAVSDWDGESMVRKLSTKDHCCSPKSGGVGGAGGRMGVGTDLKGLVGSECCSSLVSQFGRNLVGAPAEEIGDLVKVKGGERARHLDAVAAHGA